jgi:hypothetical protein
MTSWLNGDGAAATVRRVVFWRRLFAWNLGELWLQGDAPVAFEVWARLGHARSIWTGSREIPIRALAGFGEGWLLTPELIGRTIEFDEEPQGQVIDASESSALSEGLFSRKVSTLDASKRAS